MWSPTNPWNNRWRLFNYARALETGNGPPPTGAVGIANHSLFRDPRRRGQLKVTVGRAPVPTDETQEVVGHDDEMQEMLKALGYVTGNE